MIVMGTGIALTWAPTTESIMGSLPPAKAGIGSAVNDTVREVGGALGVAVLGSVLASQYTSTIDTAGVPGPAAGAAGESLGGAVVAAQQRRWPSRCRLARRRPHGLGPRVRGGAQRSPPPSPPRAPP